MNFSKLRGSKSCLSLILLQPFRNHDTPKDALNRDPTPLRLVLDPAELVAVILDLEGGRAPSLRGSRFLWFLLGSRPFASRSRLLTSSVVLRAVQVFILAFIATDKETMLIYKLDCASWPRASFRGRRDALAGLAPRSLRNGLFCVMDPVRAVHYRPLLVSLARGCSAQPARLVPVSPGGEKASAI